MAYTPLVIVIALCFGKDRHQTLKMFRCGKPATDQFYIRGTECAVKKLRIHKQGNKDVEEGIEIVGIVCAIFSHTRFFISMG